MIDRRKRLHREIAERLPAERADVAAAPSPRCRMIERMAVERAPVAAFAPRSRAARRYQDLWAEVGKRVLGLARPMGPAIRTDASGRQGRESKLLHFGLLRHG